MKTNPSTTPTLSILIPVFRYNCRQLVETLSKEARELNIPYEIILGDDCSGKDWKEIYDKWTKEIANLLIYHSHENLGAGKMRNRLVEQAKWDTILLLDSDVLPQSDSFIKDYLSSLEPNAVVCGGFVYNPNDVTSDRLLRYEYGIRIESQSAQERAKDPYKSFIAMSMLTTRQVFDVVCYPPEMGMGYEDARFGHILKLAEVPIIHIDNPVIHQLKETSEQFLATTRRYVDNLYRHRVTLKSSEIKLLDTFNKMKRMRITPILRVGWKLFHSSMERHLCGRKPSMTVFSAYKLLYISSLHRVEKPTITQNKQT